jgi:glycosyltransferase involved in cell wall biosynthesis
MPTVSVVVPNYNHARFLRQRIESILAQTYQDFELILLDDASTDESRETINQYVLDRRVRIEFNETNSGSTFKQWNKGVRLAQGKYVWIAESDDYAEPRFLERLVALLEADERVVIAYCRSWRVVGHGSVMGEVTDDGVGGELRVGEERVDGYGDPLLPAEDLERWAKDFFAQGAEECRRYFVLANLVRNASSAVFRKEAYERAGGAADSMRLCGDWKLWAGVALQGKMAYISEPLNYYRLHTGSVWGRSADGTMEIEEVLHVVRWVMEHVKPADDARKKACERLALGWVMLLMSFRVSPERKRTVLEDVRVIDPHPMRRVLRPALKTVSMKIGRHWRELRSMLSATRIAP